MSKAAALFLSALSVSALAVGQPVVSGIYSNLQWNAEGGDLIGVEVFIFPSGRGPELKYSALVQIAEGGAPFAALVPVTLRGDSIEFTLPPGGIYGSERFVGKFSGDELVLEDSRGNKDRLRRGKSYWQREVQ